jgi:hypothetical protein
VKQIVGCRTRFRPGCQCVQTIAPVFIGGPCIPRRSRQRPTTGVGRALCPLRYTPGAMIGISPANAILLISRATRRLQPPRADLPELIGGGALRFRPTLFGTLPSPSRRAFPRLFGALARAPRGGTDHLNKAGTGAPSLHTFYNIDLAISA